MCLSLFIFHCLKYFLGRVELLGRRCASMRKRAGRLLVPATFGFVTSTHD